MDKTPNVIKHYELLEQVGDGGFGRVYKARDMNTNRIVALKEIKYKDSMNGIGVSPTTLREIKILSAIHHKNIVELIDVTSDEVDKNARIDKIPPIYLVMEYIDHDLSGLLCLIKKKKIQPLPLELLRYYAYQIFQGIHFLHSNHIVHRDLKTANILFTNENVIKLADFGWARRLYINKKDYTKNIITVWYRPPEIALLKSDYRYEVDIWSAGCILAELYTCTPLFSCKADRDIKPLLHVIFSLLGLPNANSELGKQLKQNGYSFEKYQYKNQFREVFTKQFQERYPNEVVPDGLINLILSCLNYNPSERPSTDKILKHPFFTSRPIQTHFSLPNDLKHIITHEYFLKQMSKEEKKKHMETSSKVTPPPLHSTTTSSVNPLQEKQEAKRPDSLSTKKESSLRKDSKRRSPSRSSPYRSKRPPSYRHSRSRSPPSYRHSRSRSPYYDSYHRSRSPYYDSYHRSRSPYDDSYHRSRSHYYDSYHRSRSYSHDHRSRSYSHGYHRSRSYSHDRHSRSRTSYSHRSPSPSHYKPNTSSYHKSRSPSHHKSRSPSHHKSITPIPQKSTTPTPRKSSTPPSSPSPSSRSKLPFITHSKSKKELSKPRLFKTTKFIPKKGKQPKPETE